MRINTNISAMNASRNLWSTQQSIDSSMSKLSSGFRINRAADDAAGLGISNKLRADIRSMGQASRNAEQANSLLQIAEGSVGTIQKMLERMKELATQAGSDTVDAGGRTRIQEEFKALQDEITRTVDTTKFQGVELLKGPAGTPSVPGTPGSAHANEALAFGSGTANDSTVNANGTFTGTGTAVTVRRTATAWEASEDGTNFSAIATGGTFQGLTMTIVDGSSVAATGTTFTLGVTPGTPGTPAVSGGSQSFLVSSSGEYAGADAVTIDQFNLELATLGIDADDLSTSAGAITALTNLDSAMDIVNQTLGAIGASQNRIDYAQQNIKVAIQNFSAAESVIRDVDMAEEMTKFSKNNILAQAGTAMLAQANQSAQGVLQLLRG